MNDLVHFKLPSQFIASHARLSFEEMVYGYRRGWIDEHAVIDLCLAKLGSGQASELEGELALAFPDGVEKVSQILDTFRPRRPEGELAPVWRYLVLAWVYENRNSLGAPLRLVEMIYADFGYPEEMQGFVPYMPPPPGEGVGEASLLSRWETYLRGKADHYSHRDPDDENAAGR